MRSLFFGVIAFLLSAPLALAQNQDSTQGAMSIELNKATVSADGGCQLVFLGQNGLDMDFEEVTWRLAVFGADGVFRNLLALPLNALPGGKRRVVQFNLPYACDELSEIIVNDVASCKLSGSNDQVGNTCLSGLSVSSRTDIAFGI